MLKKIDDIIKLLKKEEVIALNTDSIFGFSALATSKIAIEKIYHLKKRDFLKPLSILVANIEMAEKYVYLTEKNKEIINKIPFPTSFLAKKQVLAQNINKNTDLLAFRIPKNKNLQNLIAEIKAPIVSTSINISKKQKNLDNKEEIKNHFPDIAIFDLIKSTKTGEESAIIGLTSNKIIRATKKQRELLTVPLCYFL